MKLMESHLDRNIYMELFHQHRSETIFAILIYSGTTSEEEEWLQNEPERFSHLAE